MLIQSSIKKLDKKINEKPRHIEVKSNTTKSRFISMVNKAKKYDTQETELKYPLKASVVYFVGSIL